MIKHSVESYKDYKITKVNRYYIGPKINEIFLQLKTKPQFFAIKANNPVLNRDQE